MSLIDYPARMAAVVFLPGCTFRCGFCHNPGLVEGWEKLKTVEEADLLAFLEDRKGWLEGLVITGGEPTMHKDLPEFIRKVKGLGYLVKLDTNGSNPAMLKGLIEEKLVDFIAMDIKGPREKYSEVAGVKVDIKLIEESVKLARESGLEYEFRTTVVPGLLGKEDIIKIGEWLKGSERYFIQQFISRDTLDAGLKNRAPYKPEELREMAEAARPYFGKVEVRI